MCKIKNVFAAIFAVITVMLMSTAVFAETPVFIQQPTDVVITSGGDGSVHYELDRMYVRVELWEVGGTRYIHELGGQIACPVTDAIGKTCFLRAYIPGSSEYTQSNNFTVTTNMRFIQQPQDVTVTQLTGNKVFFEVSFDPTMVVLCRADGTAIASSIDPTSCSVDDALNETCYLKAYYKNVSNTFIKSDSFKVTTGFKFTQQPQDVSVTQATGNSVSYAMNFEPMKVELWTATNVRVNTSCTATGCSVDGALGETCYIKAYFANQSNAYITSDRFEVVISKPMFLKQPAQCGQDTQNSSDIASCGYKLSFMLAYGAELHEYGTDTLITNTGSEQYCSLNGTVSGNRYYIRAYYFTEADKYVDSEPFTVNYMFTTQPYLNGTDEIAYDLNFMPCKNAQLWNAVTKECISTNGGYGGCKITGADGKTCFIRAYYSDTDYIDSKTFKIGECSVSFDPNGGSGSIDGFTVPSFTEITLPECTFNPPNNITELSHWEIDGETYYEGAKVVIRADTVVKAVWKPVYTVKFDPASGSGTIPSVMAAEGKDIVLPDCTFTPPDNNHIFTYWSIGGKLFNEGDNYTVAADTVVKAAWGRKRIVQFCDSNNNSLIDYVYAGEGEELTMPEYTGTLPKGKQFAYWVDNKNPGIPVYAGDKITVNEDMTFLSRFETKVCKVIFDTNGMGTAPDTQNVLYGNTAALPVVDNVNEYFVSAWYTNKACTEIFDFKTAINDDIILYAKWEEAALTITVDGNEKTAMVYYGDDLQFEFSDSTAPTDNKYKLWLEYIPNGQTATTTKLIKGTLPVIYSSDDADYPSILNPSNSSISAKLGAGLYATYSNAVKINLTVKYKNGDFNKNGKLDEEDAAMLLKHLSGGTQLDEEQYARADINGDGNKDILDAIATINLAE